MSSVSSTTTTSNRRGSNRRGSEQQTSAATQIARAKARAAKGALPSKLEMERWSSDVTTIDPLYGADMAPGADDTPYADVLLDHLRRSLAGLFQHGRRTVVVLIWNDDRELLPAIVRFTADGGRQIHAVFDMVRLCKKQPGVIEVAYHFYF